MILICEHVKNGAWPDVMAGGKEGTEFAVCRACADAIGNSDDKPPALTPLCTGHAAEKGIPPILPGTGAFWIRQRNEAN